MRITFIALLTRFLPEILTDSTLQLMMITNVIGARDVAPSPLYSVSVVTMESFAGECEILR